MREVVERTRPVTGDVRYVRDTSRVEEITVTR
jgi:hypothetical protein